MPDALAVLEALAPLIDNGVVTGLGGAASGAPDFGADAIDATDDEADNGAGATADGATGVAPDARDTVAAAAAMKAVRFSPHSTQKRASHDRRAALWAKSHCFFRTRPRGRSGSSKVIFQLRAGLREPDARKSRLQDSASGTLRGSSRARPSRRE